MRLLILVLGLISAAYALPRQSRIIGGSPIKIENYPFMAAILGKSQNAYFHRGSGTLITSTSIVTAVQGFYYNSSPLDTRIRLGSTFHFFGGTVHLVSFVIRHPEFNERTLINDVAIIKLTVPAVFSSTIRAARLAGPQYILPANTWVNAVGWGETEQTGKHSEILQHVAVKVIDHQICVERYAYLKTLPGTSEIKDVTNEMLCTGILDVGGKDTCHGDTGGPIIHGKDILVGISSWRYECGHPFYPGVSTRVSPYTFWIARNSH